MLVLKRKEGQWVEVIHAPTGDRIRIRVCHIEPGQPGHLNLAFDDEARRFVVERPEDLTVPQPIGSTKHAP